MTDECVVRFPKLNHFWMDSGLVGLAATLEELGVTFGKDSAGLTIVGSEQSIGDTLGHAYDCVVAKYYDVSTQKQRADTSSHNFYYDSKKEKFVTFPKRKSVGIASLIFDKAARPSGTQIPWVTKGDKKVVGKLPPEHKAVQTKLDDFLRKSGLKPGPPSGLLVDGPNRVCPNVDIPKKLTEGEMRCFLCGEATSALEEAKGSTFPLITGKSGVLSFNSGVQNAEKVCWKCAYVSKFVPSNGFYHSQGDAILAFFPYSGDFEKMMQVYRPLREAETIHPDFFSNFEHPLGRYFQKPFELTLAFLYTLYAKLLQKKAAGGDDVLDIDKLLDLVVNRASVEFHVLAAVKKGNTWMPTMTWPFTDAVYFFRLMGALEQGRLNTKQVMSTLVDHEQVKADNKTVLRERVCERLLKKQSVLELVEQHAFHISASKSANTRPLLDLVLVYEPLVRKEDGMTKEQQDVAVNVGTSIGKVLAEEQKKKGGSKGDLFRLRKVRKKVDFLNELERLLTKYSELRISDELYRGALNDENFAEFKHFCTLAALNNFNAATAETGKASNKP